MDYLAQAGRSDLLRINLKNARTLIPKHKHAHTKLANIWTIRLYMDIKCFHILDNQSWAGVIWAYTAIKCTIWDNLNNGTIFGSVFQHVGFEMRRANFHLETEGVYMQTGCTTVYELQPCHVKLYKCRGHVKKKKKSNMIPTLFKSNVTWTPLNASNLQLGSWYPVGISF